MKPLFKQNLVKSIIAILILLFIVKLVWFIVELVWLPVEGVTHKENMNAKPLYYRVKLLKPKHTASKPKPKPKPVGTIKDITLLAVYGDDKNAVVTVKYKGKTKVLGKGETVNGFTLESVGLDYAIFSKGNKEYEVTLLKSKKTKGRGYIKPVQTERTSSKNIESSSDGIVDAGDHKIVDQSLFKHYLQNIDELYKHIGIQEVKNDNKIEGFRVTFIKRGTPLAQLGVQRGDIIKSINGEELTSYSAALNAYKNITDAQNITLVIQRNNKEMELEYEIN